MGKMKKNEKKNGNFIMGYLCFLAVFLISAGVLAYPTIAALWNDKHQVNIGTGYQSIVDELDQEDYTKYWNDAVAYNDALRRTGTILTDPFDYDAAKAMADESLSDYLETLNFSDVMATVEIPKIAVNLPVYHGTSKETLEKGIGHLKGSALPVGGVGTHCILTGHTGLPGKTIFTNLTKLKLDDIFYIHVMNETLTYQIDDISVVLPTDVSKLTLEEDQDYVTLLTCTPYGVNDHRLLVRGKRISTEDMTEEELDELYQETEVTKEFSMIQKVELAAAAVAVVLFFVMLYLMISTILHQKKREKNRNTKS